MMLPLRISIDVRGWRGGPSRITDVLAQLRDLKLYAVELLVDGSSLAWWDETCTDGLPSAFERVLTLAAADRGCCPDKLARWATAVAYELDPSCCENTLASLEAVPRHEPASSVRKLSLYVDTRTARCLPAVLQRASELKMDAVVLPSPDLVSGGDDICRTYLTPADLALLDPLKQAGNGPVLEIHDYFIARYLGLPDADRFAGCQAGRLIAHVRHDVVYPCRSVPVAAGSLYDDDFATLWSRCGEIMQRYVCGTDCATCAGAAACKFACPGAAFFIGDGSRDPLCPGRS